MIVSSISYILVKKWHPESMDVAKLKEKGTIVSENRDVSLLGKINIQGIIDKDFMMIHIHDKLGKVVERIKQSKRNTFPVVDGDNKLLGLIQLDNIREEIFKPELYNQLTASALLEKPTEVIKADEDIFSIMKKFERSGQWNLPVTDNGVYVGFISKSSILLKYREELLSSV
jgi:CIC family chloride channel protein